MLPQFFLQKQIMRIWFVAQVLRFLTFEFSASYFSVSAAVLVVAKLCNSAVLIPTQCSLLHALASITLQKSNAAAEHLNVPQPHGATGFDLTPRHRLDPPSSRTSTSKQKRVNRIISTAVKEVGRNDTHKNIAHFLHFFSLGLDASDTCILGKFARNNIMNDLCTPKV